MNPTMLHEIAYKYHRIGEVPEHYRFPQLYHFNELDIARMKEQAGLN